MEFAAPVVVAEVKALDAEPGKVHRQTLTGAVEHGARQWRAARALYALALINTDFEQVIDKALVPVPAQKRQRVAPLGAFDPGAAFPGKIGDVAAGIGHRAERGNPVLEENLFHFVASRRVFGPGIKVYAPRSGGGRRAGRRRRSVDPPRRVVPQLAQPAHQRRLQASKLADIGVEIRAGAPPAIGHRGILPVVELESRQGVAAAITEKIRPLGFVGPQGAYHEHAALIARSVFDLLLEPVELIFAPGRIEVAGRHYDQQDAGMADLGSQLVGKLDGGINLLVAPDMQIIEVSVDQPDVRFQLAYQFERPLFERRVGVARTDAVRIAHKGVEFEIRLQKRHAPTFGDAPRCNLSAGLHSVETVG